MTYLNVPTEKEWGDYKSDYDLNDMHKTHFGKKIEDVYYFYNNGTSITMADDLLYSSRLVFQYYIYAFVLYLLTEMGQSDDEAKEVFLNLLLNRESKDQGSVSQIYNNKVELNYVNQNFEKYEFKISISEMSNRIHGQYLEKEIDNWLFDELPKTFEQIYSVFHRNQW